MDRIDWNMLIKTTLLIAGGVGAIALGQPHVGAIMLGAAAGAVVPGSLRKTPTPPAGIGSGPTKIILFLCLFAGAIACMQAITLEQAKAQTLYTKIDPRLAGAGAIALGPCAAPGKWSGWILVNNQKSIVYEVELDWTNATEVTMRCETSQVNSTPNDQGYDVHVIVSTSSAGLSQTEVSTWEHDGLAADTRWQWTVTNINSTYVNCLFTCDGAGLDEINLFAKGVVP